MSADALKAAAMRVQVMDTAGRIIANPRRNAVAASAAEVLALAWTAEGLNAVAIEAELLVKALELPITGTDSHDAARDHAVQTQLDILKNQFALLRTPAPEKE